MKKVVLLLVTVLIATILLGARSAQAFELEEAVEVHPRSAIIERGKWKLPRKCKDAQARMLYKAGFTKPGLLRGAWAITYRESKHQSLDESSRYYSGALGTWQIQTSSWSGKSWWSRANMLDKHTQSKIVRKHFVNKGLMAHWGYGYSFKSDSWYEDAGMYVRIWGSSLTWRWVIQPFNTGWSIFPKACRA